MSKTKFCWKNKYYDHLGKDRTGNQYVSPLGKSTGKGTKEDPLPANHSFKDNQVYIVAPGAYEIITNGNGYGLYIIGGTGNPQDIEIYDNGNIQPYFNNVTIKSLKIGGNNGFRNCIIDCNIEGEIYKNTNCQMNLVRKYSDYLNSQFMPKASFISFLDTNIHLGSTGFDTLNFALFSNSNIVIPSTNTLSVLLDKYYAFDDCRFKIGSTTEYKPLTGDTESSLRQNFIDLCREGGLDVSKITVSTTHRWMFSTNSTSGGTVIKNSSIHSFMRRKGLTQLGWKKPLEKISISKNAPSKNSMVVVNKLEASGDSLFIKNDIDISKMPQNEMTATSNIICLGEGKQQLDALDILHNFPSRYGLLMESTESLDLGRQISPSEIETNNWYLVRSNDDTEATLTYNGTTHSSSLSKRTNVFIGIEGIKDFTGSENAEVYLIKDVAMMPSIKIRIVDKIPEKKYTAGSSLPDGYWCIVEPDDLSDKSGSVTLNNGSSYPCLGSFLSKGETIIATDKCHVRRCWIDNFDIANQSDKDFWTDIQKPLWLDVVPNDLRCLKKHNNPLSSEMQKDDKGSYIGSGNQDFYALLRGENGTPKPGYSITGKYLQIELVVSTLNPM